jgi:hypothetical protein
MLAKNLILGLGRKVVVGGRINIPIPDEADLLSREELEVYIQTNELEISGPLSGLDLSVPSSPDPLASQWPQVILKSLPQLLREFRVVKTNGGHLIHNIGSQQFSSLRSNKRTWTGSQAELTFHHQQVKSLNFCLLLHLQESHGIENPDLRVRFKFFNSQQALEVLEGGRDRLRLWTAGQDRPDGNHLVAVLQQQMTRTFRYEAFELIVPSPHLSIRVRSREEEAAVTPKETPDPETLPLVAIQPIEVPAAAARCAGSVPNTRMLAQSPALRTEKATPYPMLADPAALVFSRSASHRARILGRGVPHYQVMGCTVRAASPSQS